MARAWLLHLPLSLAASILVIMIYRVYALLSNTKIRRNRIMRKEMARWVAYLVAPDLCMMILWQFLDADKPTQVDSEVTFSSITGIRTYRYHDVGCGGQNAGFFERLSYMYFAVLMCAGIY